MIRSILLLPLLLASVSAAQACDRFQSEDGTVIEIVSFSELRLTTTYDVGGCGTGVEGRCAVPRDDTNEPFQFTEDGNQIEALGRVFRCTE